MPDPIYPKPSPPVWPQLQQQFGDWLFSQLGLGLPKYGGQLSPDLSQTRLPDVWKAWQPMDAGTMFLANSISGKNPLQQQFADTFQWGGVKGKPLDAMRNMTLFGGTGGPGNYAMSNLLQFGAASPAGQWLNQGAQGYGPSFNYLAPFLAMGAGGGGGAYHSPTIPGM